MHICPSKSTACDGIRNEQYQSSSPTWMYFALNVDELLVYKVSIHIELCSLFIEKWFLIQRSRAR